METVQEHPSAARPPLWRFLRHEWTLAVLGALFVAVVLTWPTLRHPASTIPGDIADPTLQAWQIAWGGHVLLTDPTQLWHSNTFFPERYTYAYSDTLLGYAPAGMIGSGFEAALIRYNILYVLLHALAFIGAYALVRQLGAGRVGGAVAGVAWAFAPWRLAHSGHLNILSAGGIALCLAMLARGHGWSLRHGYRPDRRRPGWAFAGWLVAAWQISLGFGIGLPLVYFLLAAGVVAAGGYGWSWWRRKQRPLFGRRLFLADLAGGVVFGAVTLGIAVAYFRVVELNPHAERSLAWTELFSPPLVGLVTAPSESWLWGYRHAATRDQLVWPPEMALLPGVTLIALAAAGLLVSSFRVRHRVALAAGVLGTGLLALGSNLGADGDPGYLTLSKHLPGWDALRTPGRMMLWTSLLLAVLAAGTITAAATAIRRVTDGWSSTRQRAVQAVLLVPLALVLVEGVNRTAHPVVPTPPAAWEQITEPVLVLPSDAGAFELNVMLWTTEGGFPQVANGLAGFVPVSQEQTRAATAFFPDPASVAYLRDLGVRTVLVMPDRLIGTPWEGVAERPVDGLGVTREEVDGVLVYRLD
ncbi:hypothetical protein [Micromonospora sp. NBC_01813]|uniref:hypothetical protein n=1 Tax=Micromonospora sp. NBC_01813 TaxID=2975988 RepID=UPI002DD7AA0F|nr:hypothetical protein [Micromonospora sp. NBC_01813]WSA10323.1 hypothetical protein OG958_05885 [Micromonospora sp. NBC_01813]